MLGRLFEIMLELEEDGQAPKTAPAVPPRPDFQGLEFLVGGVWIATPMPGTTFSEAIQWTLDSQFMTSTQISSTPPNTASLTNGFLGVDPATQLIVMWGFSNTGFYVNLTQVKSSAPDTWVLAGVVDGKMTQQTMIKLNAQQMKTITATLIEGKWQAKPPVSYERAP